MENIQDLHSIDKLIADFTQNVLGLNDNQVLISYQPKGQQSPKFGSTTIFVHTAQEQDDVQLFKNRESSRSIQTGTIGTEQTSLRRLSVQFSIYGNNCDTIATKLKETFYFESSRLFLEQNNLALIPSRTQIRAKIHEDVNGRWWERVELFIGLYNTITIDESVSPFKSVEINVSEDSGLSVVIGG